MKLPHIFIILILLSALSSAQECNELHYMKTSMSCKFTRDVPLKDGHIADILACDERIVAEVCASRPKDDCGFSWSYHKNYESIDIIDCFVIHEGKVLPCDLSKVRKIPSDEKNYLNVLQLEMPSCSKGDFYNILKRKYHVDPTLKGFEEAISLAPVDVEDLSVFEITVPNDINLSYYSSLGTKPEITVGENATLYKWEKHNQFPVAEEELMPPDYEIYDKIYVSSRKDYSGIREWLNQFYVSEPENEIIRKKASEIAGNESGETAIRLIYDWVRRNIEYSASPFDADTGFRPEKSSTVLEKGIGDCKDISALLSDLLKARGFDAEPAMFGTHHTVPMKSAFDHVITKVRYNNKTTWLDATCYNCPYGTMLPDTYGKYVLPLSSASLEKIPEEDAKEFETNIILTYDLTATDPAKITYEYEYADLISAEAERIKLNSMTSSDRDKHLEEIARSSCLNYEILEKEIINLNDSYKPLILRLVYSCWGTAYAQNNTLSIWIEKTGELPSYLVPQSRNYDMVMTGGEKLTETTEILFPGNYRIDSIDISEFNYSSSDYEISNSYLKEGDNKIRITRKFFVDNRVSKDIFRDFKEAYSAHLRKKIIVTAVKTGSDSVIMFVVILVLLVPLILICNKARKRLSNQS